MAVPDQIKQKGSEMDSSSLEHSIVLYGSLAIFNLANLTILNRVLKQDLSGLLSEKSPVLPPVAATGDPVALPPSYSRLTGLIGGTVLAIFLWAFGNVVIYLCLTDTASVQTVLASVGSYFLAGSALFAPYAFNQLRTSFNPTGIS